MSVTLKELMVTALGFADFPKDSLDADQETQLIGHLNAGLKELWEAMIDAHMDVAHKVAPTITLVSGTESYSLPSDFYKAVKVWLSDNSRRYRLERFSLDEIDGLPKPLTAGSVELWYAPPLPKLRTKGQTVPAIIPDGWEQYAALFAAVRLLDEEETDSSKWSAERDRFLQRIINFPAQRDEEPESIRDYYNRYSRPYISWDRRTRDLRYRIMGDKIWFVEIEQGGA